jgi:hypothetical protein
VDLSVYYARDGVKMRLGGRADFIHGPKPLWIVDGKGSVHREKYVDSEQLIWYALLHYIKHHVAPDRLGFLHYRFPDDPCNGSFTMTGMRSFWTRPMPSLVLILGVLFDPSPPVTAPCESGFVLRGTKHLASRPCASGGPDRT